MRKLILPILAVASLSATAQTKKVFMEDYTGTWCGWCPEGTVVQEQLKAANGANFIPVATHNADPMEIPDGAAVDVALNVTGYPNGSVDRYKFASEAKVPFGRGAWSNYTAQRLAMPAIASVSISGQHYKPSTQTYEMDVKIKFTSLPTAGVPINVQVYMLQDSIPATGSNEQANYSGSVQGGADPLTNWWHNHVLVKALGGTWGYTGVVPATPVVNTVYSKHVSFPLESGWIKKNMKVVAFVAYNGSTAFQKEIMNSEEMSLKSFWPLGVEPGQEEAVRILGVYPNPAVNGGLVKIEYNALESGRVTLRVYDVVGQLVDVPYDGNEVEGSHTIHWNPSAKNLPAGIYSLQLSTAGGKVTQRVTVQ